MDKLKPCPFCGGEAFMDEGIDADGATVYRIGCAHLICGMCPRTVNYSKEDTIEAWNRRADGWISVEDKMPKVPEKTYSTKTWVIACVEGHENSCCRAYERAVLKTGVKYRWLYPWGSISDERITHWQPLPKPPKKEGE